MEFEENETKRLEERYAKYEVQPHGQMPVYPQQPKGNRQQRRAYQKNQGRKQNYAQKFNR